MRRLFPKVHQLRQTLADLERSHQKLNKQHVQLAAAKVETANQVPNQRPGEESIWNCGRTTN
jgi:hypothetical protein